MLTVRSMAGSIAPDIPLDNSPDRFVCLKRPLEAGERQSDWTERDTQVRSRLFQPTRRHRESVRARPQERARAESDRTRDKRGKCMADRLLKPEEVAERLAVSAKMVRSWLREGKLPGVRLGRLWRIDPQALEQFLKTGRAESRREAADGSDADRHALDA